MTGLLIGLMIGTSIGLVMILIFYVVFYSNQDSETHPKEFNQWKNH